MNKYKITTPCSQDWNKMETVENGRFCKHCNKTVHDLTDGKDFIPPSTNETFCGRIIDETSLIPKKIRFSRLIFWQRMMRLSPLLASLLLGKTAYSQTKDNIVFSKDSMDIKEQEMKLKGKIVISGRLRDADSTMGLSFANVLIIVKGNEIAGGQTDIDGNFKIIIDSNYFKAKFFDINVAYVGFENLILKDIPLSNKNFIADLSLKMKSSIMGIMVFTIETQCPPSFIGLPTTSGGDIKSDDIKHMPR
jgi:hypothetical protein